MSVRVERAQPAAGRAEGLALLLFTVVGWGLNWPALKLVLEHLPPFSMRTVTAAAGGTIVMAMAALRGERLAPPSGQWRRLTLAAFLNYTSWLGFVSVSLVWLPASTAVIITYTMPVWAMCLAWPVLGERPRASHLMGLALGIGGVAAVLDGGRAAIPPGGLPGVACALAASVLFALGSVITKRAPLSMPPFAAVGWQILIGVVPIAVLALLLERPDFGALALHDWLALAYTAFVGLVLSYLCWFRALKLLPASVATAGTLLVPLVGVFGSGLVLGEPIGPAQLLALALTISGVALVARS